MQNENTIPTAREANTEGISAPGGSLQGNHYREARFDVYKIVTDRIISELEAGSVPWKKPWASGNAFPVNFSTQKKYRGINVFLLSCAGFSSPYWLTFKQARSLGGNVKKGQKGFPVIYWNFVGQNEVNEETGEESQRKAFAKYYTVFNAEQIEGIEYPPVANIVRSEFEAIEDCENILAKFLGGPEILHERQTAFYSPTTDTVNMPKKESFDAPENYYAALFHELTHSSGHGKRLNRDGITKGFDFGSHGYSKEELVAEMGAAFLCGIAGISPVTIENSAAYIKGWLSALSGNRKLLVQAAGAAQKAADFIQGISIHKEAITETI